MSEGSRRLLGRHVKPKDRSVLVYSRDALARPLRELGEVLSHIGHDRFHPDKTRSGYWSGQARMECVTGEQIPAETLNTDSDSQWSVMRLPLKRR
eukprot:6480467-Amphidinium_carterae.1